MIIRHSVVILTYNQENYIETALQSALEQDPIPYEIVIGDDSSVDNTSKILLEYQQKYPQIIKIYRHKENLGIFKNLNFVIAKITGDVVSFLGGDDYFKPGIFRELNKMIDTNHININDDFIIITNTSSLYPNGKEVLFDNFRYRDEPAFKQRLRYSLDNRDVGISTTLLKKVSQIRTDFGYHADWLWTLDLDFRCQNHYYSSFVSSVYRVGVGIVSSTKSEILLKSRLKVLSEVENIYTSILNEKDLLFLKLDRAYVNYSLKPNFESYVLFLLLYFKNVGNINENCYLSNVYMILPKSVIEKLIIFKHTFINAIKIRKK